VVIVLVVFACDAGFSLFFGLLLRMSFTVKITRKLFVRSASYHNIMQPCKIRQIEA
jgi:hypothetical protein